MTGLSPHMGILKMSLILYKECFLTLVGLRKEQKVNLFLITNKLRQIYVNLCKPISNKILLLTCLYRIT